MTAMMLNANSTSAETRVPKPSTSSTGKISSTPLPSRAAISGGSSGTAYSLSNSATVESQFTILVSPDLKKTLATKSRTPRSTNGARRFRPLIAGAKREAARHTTAAGPTGRWETRPRFCMTRSFQCFETKLGGPRPRGRGPAVLAFLGSAVHRIRIVGDVASNDALAGTLGNVDPGFRVAIGRHRARARALARAAVVLAGLDDAGAFFVVLLLRIRRGRGRGDAQHEKACYGAADELATGFHGSLRKDLIRWVCADRSDRRANQEPLQD